MSSREEREGDGEFSVSGEREVDRLVMRREKEVARMEREREHTGSIEKA